MTAQTRETSRIFYEPLEFSPGKGDSVREDGNADNLTIFAPSHPTVDNLVKFNTSKTFTRRYYPFVAVSLALFQGCDSLVSVSSTCSVYGPLKHV